MLEGFYQGFPVTTFETNNEKKTCASRDKAPRAHLADFIPNSRHWFHFKHSISASLASKRTALPACPWQVRLSCSLSPASNLLRFFQVSRKEKKKVKRLFLASLITSTLSLQGFLPIKVPVQGDVTRGLRWHHYGGSIACKKWQMEESWWTQIWGGGSPKGIGYKNWSISITLTNDWIVDL